MNHVQETIDRVVHLTQVAQAVGANNSRPLAILTERDLNIILESLRALRRRGQGLTTLQLRGAPPGSIFVDCNENTRYVRDLIQEAGRKSDIRVIRLSDLEREYRYAGLNISAVIFDHACELTESQRAGAEVLCSRVRIPRHDR